MSARNDQAEALWARAADLDRAFHAGDKSAGPKARAAALKAAELERQGNADRNRQLLELRAKAPKRAAAPQADAGHLPLFIAANEPRLI